MKNQFFLFSLAALVALASCSDDNNPPADSGYTVVIALNGIETTDDVSQIDQVQAVISGSNNDEFTKSAQADVSAGNRRVRSVGRMARSTAGVSYFVSVATRQGSGDDSYIAGSASLSGNSFAITLGNQIPNRFLTSITESFAGYGEEDCEVEFSNLNAQCSEPVEFVGFRQGEPIGTFWSETTTFPTAPMGEPEIVGEPEILYIYVDRPVTIKGFDYSDGYNDWFDLSFQKGWNRFCWYYREDGEGDNDYYGAYFVVSDIPSGHKWCYRGNLVFD